MNKLFVAAVLLTSSQITLASDAAVILDVFNSGNTQNTEVHVQTDYLFEHGGALRGVVKTTRTQHSKDVESNSFTGVVQGEREDIFREVVLSLESEYYFNSGDRLTISSGIVAQSRNIRYSFDEIGRIHNYEVDGTGVYVAAELLQCFSRLCIVNELGFESNSDASEIGKGLGVSGGSMFAYEAHVPTGTRIFISRVKRAQVGKRGKNVEAKLGIVSGLGIGKLKQGALWYASATEQRNWQRDRQTGLNIGIRMPIR